ncbi:MAG: ATP-dependent DNA helicase RecG [Eubacteriales bacterium]|nr:ATP-dependent DNA helicase RecG [Eubacteriales bacterium]
MNIPVRELKGVGGKTEAILQEMQIVNTYDLLTYYPKSYDFFQGLTKVSDLKMGVDNFLHLKIVSKAKLQYFGKLSLLSFYAADEENRRVKINYFRQPYLAKLMPVGRVMILKGRPFFKNGELCLTNPAVLSEEDWEDLKNNPIVARYSVRKGISEKKLKQYLKQVLERSEEIPDYISEELCRKYHLLSLAESFRAIHFPGSREEIEMARRRRVFDEFYFFQAGFVKGQKEKNDFPIAKMQLKNRFVNSLPFTLTTDQKKAIESIAADMSGNYRMKRLLQGDVGSGKTAVAFAVALMAIESGCQVALMAPTEVLARQHFLDAKDKLEPLGVRIGLLLGSDSAKQKKERYADLQSGHIDLLIGTHSLIQEKVVYRNLGLVITDEQHRFGVMQRERLSQKGQTEKLPHVLVMSATPIPRSLALILYQDMDISVIKSMPTERLPIQSYLRDGKARNRIFQFMEKKVRQGAAAYIVCPAIEDNEELALTGVISYAEELQKKYPHLKIAYLYGGQEEKEEVMEKFVKGELEILISTTVIEVGVNVPRASIMLIENAERFGLAQLHQLRGRVGRGNRQSYCIFLSESKDKSIREKLQFVAEHGSGFEIAEYDLKMRGPGDAFGIKQHGMPMLQLADLYQDLPILELVQSLSPEIKDSKVRQEYLTLYYGGDRQILSI